MLRVACGKYVQYLAPTFARRLSISTTQCAKRDHDNSSDKEKDANTKQTNDTPTITKQQQYDEVEELNALQSLLPRLRQKRENNERRATSRGNSDAAKQQEGVSLKQLESEVNLYAKQIVAQNQKIKQLEGQLSAKEAPKSADKIAAPTAPLPEPVKTYVKEKPVVKLAVRKVGGKKKKKKRGGLKEFNFPALEENTVIPSENATDLSSVEDAAVVTDGKGDLVDSGPQIALLETLIKKG